MKHLSMIMKNAWSIFKSKTISFSESLKLSWKKYYKLVQVTILNSNNPLKLGIAVRVKNNLGFWDITKFYVFKDQIMNFENINYIDDYVLSNIGTKLGYTQTVALR